MTKDRAQKALELIQKGYSAQEITRELGYKNASAVYNLAKSHNIKIQKFNAKKHEQMREYKAEGHTMQEVAEKFGVTTHTAQTVCKGINPQKPRPPEGGYSAHNKGVLQDIDKVVIKYAESADDAGLDGVVCSPLEAGKIHSACGKAFLTVTPGVRFADGDKGDQVRVTTPEQAKEIGSDYIVVGRPITQAADPVAAYNRCVAEFVEE
jgi:hypothetical protein